MDLRPQAHDIIRTWLFATIVRSYLEEGCLPWANAAISGWILDPDRKKMSKSVGNVITPRELLEKHGSDGVRYWAASGRPGHGHGFRGKPDGSGPKIGAQDPERLEVRPEPQAVARARRRRGRRHGCLSTASRASPPAAAERTSQWQPSRLTSPC